MHLSARTTYALVLFLAVACATVLIMLTGCKSVTGPVVRLATAMTTSGPAQEQYQIPVETNKVEEPAGWEKEKVLEITVPPSDKPTTLYVKKNKTTLREALLPVKSDKVFDMVSDNPGATAKEEAKTPWWYWALGLAAFLGILAGVLKRYTAPLAFIAKFFKRG